MFITSKYNVLNVQCAPLSTEDVSQNILVLVSSEP